MIADLRPYPKYKESGLPWLGKVPGHWGQRRMKFLFNERIQKGFPEEPLLAATQSKGVVRKDHYGARTVTAMKDFHLLKLVETGDFVISLRSFEGGIELAHCRGIISPAYTILTPRREVRQGYYSRFFKSPDFISSLTLFVTGIREGQNIDYERLSRAYMPLPPAEEQAAIGRFLDWANGRLERAIRAKRKVIALLTEQKQAIIHRAVTRGLHSTGSGQATSVPLKPSGIPWLGDILQHWGVRRLRHLIKGRLTYGANAAAEFTNPDWPRYIRITDFRADGSLKAETFRSLPPSIACDFLVEPGDILLARSGATVGKAFLVVKDTGAACHAGYLIRARPHRGLVSPEFLFAFTQSRAFAAWKDSTFNTATIQNIGADKYANLAVPFPSLAEQQAILDSLADEQAPLLTAISRLEREIELLREYRTRLIADVVTGKLDVREAAAKLPEETAPAATDEPANLSNEADHSDEEATE
ncbi:MAG: restriction endonuclease subunit S [candidate division NC10 bacterium]|nr:restriction endonuclease subunit S [candidate division NC10 bacterium]